MPSNNQPKEFPNIPKVPDNAPVCVNCGHLAHGSIKCSECLCQLLYIKSDQPSVPAELRYKEDFARAFDGGQSHWGDELTIGMLAEYASEVACDLITRSTKQAVVAALTEFGEFCHERYLGCTQDSNSPTGYEYGYTGEVVIMAEEFVARIKAGDTK